VAFTATVTGSSNTAVQWMVGGINAGPVEGTISADGVYTAPSGPGLFVVGATAEADTTKGSSTMVTVSTPGIVLSGALNFPRLQHTATLLPNGKVLIAGGGIGPDVIDGYWIVSPAEIYDPATDTFTTAGVISRDGPTATLLQDGSVLLAGGEAGPNIATSNTADLEIAGSGSFEPTGSMLSEREAHTATLLKDGRVLVAGGLIPNGLTWQAIAEAELYDPASGTFSSAGKMNVARAVHTATLLASGKVLLTGGCYVNPCNSAELFDPGTGRFTPTGNMLSARSGQTATLLPNGKVLIAGGGSTGTTIAELYDPDAGTFTPTGSMAVSRGLHTATLLPDGRVLIAGGSSEAPNTEIYSPATGMFTPGPAMKQGRFMHTATLLPGGRVLIAGGYIPAGNAKIRVLGSAEVLTP
jgi:hypothetical protein